MSSALSVVCLLFQISVNDGSRSVYPSATYKVLRATVFFCCATVDTVILLIMISCYAH